MGRWASESRVHETGEGCAVLVLWKDRAGQPEYSETDVTAVTHGYHADAMASGHSRMSYNGRYPARHRFCRGIRMAYATPAGCRLWRQRVL